MKTISPACPSPNRTGFLPVVAVFALIAAIAVFATPVAHAAGADGSYRMTQVSGTFVANGQTVEVPNVILTNALLRNGRIIVLNNKVPIYRAKWGNLLDEFSYAGFTGSAQVSGPSNLLLNPVNGTFAGKTTTPVRLTINGDYMGTPINMTMSMTFKAKVIGNTMTLTVPVTINAMGIVAMKGTIRMTAKR